MKTPVSIVLWLQSNSVSLEADSAWEAHVWAVQRASGVTASWPSPVVAWSQKSDTMGRDLESDQGPDVNAVSIPNIVPLYMSFPWLLFPISLSFNIRVKYVENWHIVGVLCKYPPCEGEKGRGTAHSKKAVWRSPWGWGQWPIQSG